MGISWCLRCKQICSHRINSVATSRVSKFWNYSNPCNASKYQNQLLLFCNNCLRQLPTNNARACSKCRSCCKVHNQVSEAAKRERIHNLVDEVVFYHRRNGSWAVLVCFKAIFSKKKQTQSSKIIVTLGNIPQDHISRI